MQFSIPYSAPSWNIIYSSAHWTLRKKLADRWHGLVIKELKRLKVSKIKSKKTIKIIIKSYYKDNRTVIDPDNICAKLIIDGLKGYLINDDDYHYISSVTTQSFIDKDNPRTEIELL